MEASSPSSSSATPSTPTARNLLHANDVLLGVTSMELEDITPDLISTVVSLESSSDESPLTISALERLASELTAELVRLEQAAIQDYVHERQVLENLYETATQSLLTLRQLIIRPAEELLKRANHSVSKLEQIGSRSRQMSVRATNCTITSRGLSRLLQQAIISPRVIRGIMLEASPGDRSLEEGGASLRQAELFSGLLNDVWWKSEVVERVIRDYVPSSPAFLSDEDSECGSPVDINDQEGLPLNPDPNADDGDEETSTSTTTTSTYIPSSLDSLRRVLKALVDRSCHRIYDFLRRNILDRIFDVSSSNGAPNSTAQFFIRQSQVLKYKDYCLFLRRYDSEAYENLCVRYAEGAAMVYLTQFRLYSDRVLKVCCARSSKRTYLGRDSICLDESRTDAMRHDNVLSRGGDERLPIIPQYEERDRTSGFGSVHFEEAFRSLIVLLLDVVGAEYVFALSFFGSVRAVSHVRRIFLTVIGFIIHLVEVYLTETSDILGVLMILRYVDWYDRVMEEERGMGSLLKDPLFGRLREILWPRCKYLFSLHLRSLGSIEVIGSKDTKNVIDGVSFSSPESKKIVVEAREEMNSFSVTKLYANFVEAIHTIARPAQERVLAVNMTTLRKLFLRFLRRVARTLESDLSSSSSTPTHFHQSVFFINACELVVRQLLHRGIVESPTGTVLRKLLEAQVHSFVELQLRDYFGDVISFTLMCETMLLENEDVDLVSIFEREGSHKVESIDVAFRNRWEAEMDRMWTEHERRFHDLELALDVTKKVLIQLSLYYGRFFNVVKRMYEKPIVVDETEEEGESSRVRQRAIMPLKSLEFGPQHIMRFRMDSRSRAARRRTRLQRSNLLFSSRSQPVTPEESARAGASQREGENTDRSQSPLPPSLFPVAVVDETIEMAEEEEGGEERVSEPEPEGREGDGETDDDEEEEDETEGAEVEVEDGRNEES